MVIPSPRRGGSSFGCLVIIVVSAAAIYLALLFARPWFRNEQYQQEMKNLGQEASGLPDSLIRVRLIARSDSLELPRAARQITIRRLPREDVIEISASYEVTIEIPLYGPKVLTFRPAVREPL